MPDVPCFMIANFVVHDSETYRKYEKGFFPILKRHGGEFFTFDDHSDTLEGSSPPPGRIVIFKFPSEEHARAWWADPDYQALSEHRRAGTNMEFLTLVHGLPPRELVSRRPWLVLTWVKASDYPRASRSDLVRLRPGRIGKHAATHHRSRGRFLEHPRIIQDRWNHRDRHPGAPSSGEATEGSCSSIPMR